MAVDKTSKPAIVDVPREPGRTRDDYRTLLLSDTPLLDVRAPVEFQKGAFPQSVNLPLMSDEERHLVGIRYKESGQDSAIELGAELVTPQIRQERVSEWQRFARDNQHAALYCFRGGLRSRISQHWLSQAGVDLPLVEGGYKAIRTFLIQTLEELCSSMGMTLVGGRTGNGKTLLIKRLGNMLDLEGLAHHRGSSFGGLVGAQPSNIDFENALCVEMMRQEEAGISQLFIEDEARLIGRVCLPDVLMESMKEASIVILETDMQTRIVNCFDDYVPDLLSRYIAEQGRDEGFNGFKDHHRGSLSRIQKRFGSDNYRCALELLEFAMDKHENHDDSSHYSEFIEMLLSNYYDPMYDYQLSKKEQRIVFKGTADEIVSWSHAL